MKHPLSNRLPASMSISTRRAFEDQADSQRWLFFHADWCPHCEALDADITANLDDIPADVVIFKVDFDNSQELKQQYGVNRQTTIVAVDAAAEEVKSFNATGSETLAALIGELYIEPPVEEETMEEGEDANLPDGNQDEDSDDGNQDEGSAGDEDGQGGQATETQPAADGEQTAPMPSSRYVDFNEAAFDGQAASQRWLFFPYRLVFAMRSLGCGYHRQLG